MAVDAVARRDAWRCSAAALPALACALLVSCTRSPAFATLDASGGDNDSLLRLVQVRDLLGGQGWFDLHQYRMGPEGGFVMHWSRLVDAPIAAIILAVAGRHRQHGIGRNRRADRLAARCCLAAAMFFLIRIGSAVGGDWAMLPASSSARRRCISSASSRRASSTTTMCNWCCRLPRSRRCPAPRPGFARAIAGRRCAPR